MKRDLFKKVTGLALVGALAFAGLGKANAEGEMGQANRPDGIVKVLDLTQDDKAIVPNKDFEFTVTPMDVGDTAIAQEKAGDEATSAVTITQKSDTFLTTPEGGYKINLNSTGDNSRRGDVYGKVNFVYGANPDVAGIYGYTISEKTDENTPGISYDNDNQRKILFFFANKEDGTGTELNRVIVVNQDGAKTGQSDATKAVNGAKPVDNADAKAGDVFYTNTYTTHSVTVTKQVDGDLADHRREFLINTEATLPTSNAHIPGGLFAKDESTAAIATAEGKVVTTDKKLSHSKSYTISGLVPGTTIKVDEPAGADNKNTEGYTVTYKVGDEAATETFTDQTISDKDLSITVINKMNQEVPTGLVNTILPFIVVIALALIAGRIYFKKNEEERA